MNDLLLTTLSFLVGIIVGLTGIGGASLITPMLIFIFHVPPAMAVSSDVVAATLMKVVGSVKHWQQNTLDIRVVKWLTVGSVPGSLIGVVLLHFLRQKHESYLDCILLRFIGFVLLSVTVIALVDWLGLSSFKSLFPKFDLTTGLGRGLTIGIGSILGCLVGLTSISSGAMFALVLMSFFEIDPHKLVGTDISQASILLMFTSLGHLSLGTVHWDLVIPIWLGSIPGVLVGAKLCQFVPQNTLKLVIYGILLMVSGKLVYTV